MTHATSYITIIAMPSNLEAEFSGLLGNNHGDDSDDLVTREGEYLGDDVNGDSKLAISWHEHDEENPEYNTFFLLFL
jgi:hypothetical protein